LKNLKNIAHWENWPFKLIYAPLVPFWAWNILRSGWVWYFTPSNPKLTFGGMDGEPKKEMYDLLPIHLIPITLNVLPTVAFESVMASVQQKGITFPLVVKPEVGCAGVLFRKIDQKEELRKYHQQVPVEYIIQELITYPMEVSVFYVRHPTADKGVVTGFLHKIPLNVTGDGFHTLEQLVLLHQKASIRVGELHSKHKENWHRVLQNGENYMLSHAANHNRGAHFFDLKEHIDERLVAIFDEISLGINDFFYGRYDILCSSIEDLKNGKNFSILEYNGCGAEPNHIYDTGYSLFEAYKEILKHWEDLYIISRYNRKQGIAPWPLWKGFRFRMASKAHFKMLQKVDASIR